MVAHDSEMVVNAYYKWNKLFLVSGWESEGQHNFKHRALSPKDGYFLAVGPGPPRLRQCVLDFARDHPEYIPPASVPIPFALCLTRRRCRGCLCANFFGGSECSGVLLEL